MANPSAAAIDIGSTMHMAAINPQADDNPVREFGTFTGDLHEMARWFKTCSVTSVAMESTGVYWIPAYEVLEQHGFDVILVMRINGIRLVRTRKHKVTTDSHHRLGVAANWLDGDFAADAPNRKWAGDITYIWTSEGWLYLAVILDMHSRRVVGWAASDRMKKDLAIRALDIAVRLRLPPEGCIFHSDRGSQCCSYDYQKKLQAYGLRPSMNGKGNCSDNASVETSFKSLKAELIWRQSWPTRRQAEAAIFQYINGFYNTPRRHSYLGGISPLAFEAKVA